MPVFGSDSTDITDITGCEPKIQLFFSDLAKGAFVCVKKLRSLLAQTDLSCIFETGVGAHISQHPRNRNQCVVFVGQLRVVTRSEGL